MGLLARVLRSSGLTHGRPPCSFWLSPGDVVPMVPNLISNPQMLYPVSFIPCQPTLPACGEVAESSIRLGITCECYMALVEC
jgi:hypothetical protein